MTSIDDLPKPSLGAPLYPHDSETSVFLGIYKDVTDGVAYDLYYQPGNSWQETVIARFGADGEYRSGMFAAFRSGMFAAHGQDPVLTEARRRAIAQHLIMTPLHLHQDGVILVNLNGAMILGEGRNIVLLSIDLHSKYVEIDSDNEVDDVPSLSLVAGEATIKTNPAVGGHVETVITFPRYQGWRVACAESRGRYSISVTLMKEPDDTPESTAAAE